MKRCPYPKGGRPGTGFRCGLAFLCYCLVLTVQADTPAPSDWAGEGWHAEAADREEVLGLLDSASLHLRQNAFEPALADLERAYELTRARRDDPLFLQVLNALATAYYDAGELPLAQRYYEQALAMDSDDDQARAITLFNLGHINASGGRFEEAGRQFAGSLALSRKNNDLSGEAYAHKALGVNALASGDTAAARQEFGAALATFAQLGDGIQAANVNRHLGDTALAEGQVDEAIQAYLQALPVYMENTMEAGQMRVYRGLSAAYEERGDFEKSLLAHKAYAILQQELMAAQGREGTKRVQAEFETRRYADENDHLLTLNRSQQDELAYQQSLLNRQYIIIALAAGVLLLIFLLFLRSQQFARQMQSLAITDELTGLFNRRAILQKGISEWQRARRFERPLSCLMFDIDHFKRINDTYGHETGDQVLREVARAIKDSLRQSDSLGRLGGEEFLLIAPETEPGKAESLAERIRRNVAGMHFANMAGQSVTLSIGVAQSLGERSLEELIREADGALYTAKHEGRNQVVMCQA